MVNVAEDNKDKLLKKGEKAAGIAAVIAFLLTLLKVIAGLLTGSIVLLVDALDGILDLVSSLASWFGLRIAQKKPDEKFPYGYYKAESIVTLLISAIILYAAIELLMTGYHRLFELPVLEFPLLAVGVALLSAIVSYFLARYLAKVGKQINSSLLIATSRERKKDVFSSFVVFGAIISTYFRLPYAEGIVTILLSLLILVIGLKTAKDAVFALMDVSPSKQIDRKVKKAINSVPDVEGFDDLKLRKAGLFIFGEVKVKVKKFVDVQRAHLIASKIEEKVCLAVPQVESFSVHIEPYEPSIQKLVIPIKEDKGLNSEVMNHFGRTNYFLFVTLEKNKIKEVHAEKNPYKKKDVRAGLSTAHYLVKQKTTALTTKKIGEIAFHTLRDHLVQIYETKGTKASEVIENFANKKLTPLAEPTHEKD
ncbi:cation diffusion facilitator family transporter [archaeon]|nr:cation diffusion facilitator family transporter [archaeon]